LFRKPGIFAPKIVIRALCMIFRKAGGVAASSRTRRSR
jgi:hypothetical protein